MNFLLTLFLSKVVLYYMMIITNLEAERKWNAFLTGKCEEHGFQFFGR